MGEKFFLLPYCAPAWKHSCDLAPLRLAELAPPSMAQGPNWSSVFSRYAVKGLVRRGCSRWTARRATGSHKPHFSVSVRDVMVVVASIVLGSYRRCGSGLKSDAISSSPNFTEADCASSSTPAANCALRSWSATIFSSMVPATMSLYTNTGLVCPIR
jgi:hypothetical protein